MSFTRSLLGVTRPEGIWNGYEHVTRDRYLQQQREGMTTPTGGTLPPLTAWDEPASECAPVAAPAVLGDAGLKHPYEEQGLTQIIEALLAKVIGETSREGLKETPVRVVGAWREWTSGYGADPASILKVFEDGAEGCDEMVVVHNIPVYSKCEHHLADIFGTATVAYIPNGRIVGLSKLPRLVDIFARRLQVQERLTNQVAEAIMEHLKPRGCGVVVKARHMCMESRGIRQAGSFTTTSALRGVFKEDPAVRAEFLDLARN